MCALFPLGNHLVDLVLYDLDSETAVYDFGFGSSLVKQLNSFFCLLQRKVTYPTSFFLSCEFRQILNELRILKSCYLLTNKVLKSTRRW